jgi:hypothetical protein
MWKLALQLWTFSHHVEARSAVVDFLSTSGSSLSGCGISLKLAPTNHFSLAPSASFHFSLQLAPSASFHFLSASSTAAADCQSQLLLTIHFLSLLFFHFFVSCYLPWYPLTAGFVILVAVPLYHMVHLLAYPIDQILFTWPVHYVSSTLLCLYMG